MDKGGKEKEEGGKITEEEGGRKEIERRRREERGRRIEGGGRAEGGRREGGGGIGGPDDASFGGSAMLLNAATRGSATYPRCVKRSLGMSECFCYDIASTRSSTTSTGNCCRISTATVAHPPRVLRFGAADGRTF